MAMVAMAAPDMGNARNVESNAQVVQSSTKEVKEVEAEKPSSSAISTATLAHDDHEEIHRVNNPFWIVFMGVQ